jgi:hypothetical protein
MPNNNNEKGRDYWLKAKPDKKTKSLLKQKTFDFHRLTWEWFFVIPFIIALAALPIGLLIWLIFHRL